MTATTQQTKIKRMRLVAGHIIMTQTMTAMESLEPDGAGALQQVSTELCARGIATIVTQAFIQAVPAVREEVFAERMATVTARV